MRCRHDYVYARGMMHCRKCNKQIEPRIGRQRRRHVKKTVVIVLLAVMTVGAFFGLPYLESIGAISMQAVWVVFDTVTDEIELVDANPASEPGARHTDDFSQVGRGDNADSDSTVTPNQSDQTGAPPNTAITENEPPTTIQAEPPGPVSIPIPLPEINIKNPITSPTQVSDGEALQESRLLMLDLINEERGKRGLNPVSMGTNAAAQAHADDLLAGCTAGHWGTDGLKPYMRYSLVGGYQHNAENVSGLDYCVGYGYVSVTPAEGVREAMSGLMTSPGHRDNILDPRHASVNIGVANDGYNTMVVQHFEYDYVNFESLPEIDGGMASFAAIVAPSLNFDDYGVTLYYDPPPHSLEQGQLSRTYCYDLGEPIASIRPALSGGWEYTEDAWSSRLSDCPNPYDVPASMPAPSSPQEAELHHEEAKRQSNMASQGAYISKVVPWYTANDWKVSGDRFEMKVKIADLLHHYGPGVYTFSIGGFIGDDYISLSEYSVFHDIEIPGER